MLTMVETFMTLEENLTTCFDNSMSSDPHFSRLLRKEPYKRWDDSNRNIQGNYAPLKVYHEMIYQECMNIGFRKAGIQPSYSIRAISLADRLKYCRFHKSHGYNTDVGCHRTTDKGRSSE